MKCDELKAYRNIDVAFNTARQTETVIAEDYEGYAIEFEEDDEVYIKEEVDAAIAELKAENAELKKKLKAEKSIGATFSKNGADLAQWVEELRKEIESLKASHYAEMVDAGMRERRLKRTLWLARANRALEKIAWFKLWNASISSMNPEDGARQEYDKWKKNLGKFLKKAEK